MKNSIPFNKNFPENNDLHTVIHLLNSGSNVFLTGCGGTGKSYILKQLKSLYKDKLTLTSTTGLSAYNIGGQTIHSWANVKCMNKPIEKIKTLFRIRNFDDYGEAKRRIKKCSILAIDEISMLSAYQLEYLNDVFQTVKENTLPFGGIQVIFIGDFLQLPPVCTEEDAINNPERTKYCFESPLWAELNFKNILLKKIYRQENLRFSQMLCNFRIGQIVEEDLKLLKTRLTYENKLIENKLHIFPRKREVKEFNEKKLEQLKSPLYEFIAKDKIPIPDGTENEEEYRLKKWIQLDNNCQAEKRLYLKVGCRVMLLQNIDTEIGLNNGSCGYVLEISKSFVIVKFDNGIIKKITYSIFKENVGDTVVGKRYQIPLKLAYAITIHKVQGMTFDEVVIDCKSSFSPGQVYVALSRVRTLNGLFLTGFNERKLYPNQLARKFYCKLNLQDYVQNIELLRKQG